jgi:hypothetical protein
MTILATWGRHDRAPYRLTNCLARRVAEDTLRTAIPAGDDAIQIFAYNRVIAGFNDGSQPTQAFSLSRSAASISLVVEAIPIVPPSWSVPADGWPDF